MPVIVDDDEDATGIILAETMENGILIRCMRNKNRFHKKHPKSFSKGKKSFPSRLWGRFEEVKCFLVF